MEDGMAELIGRIAVIEARVEANRWLAVAIAAGMVKMDRNAHDPLCRVIEAATVHLAATGEAHAAEALSVSTAMFKAISQEGNVDPARALVIKALLHLEAGSDHQKALASWIEMATDAELSDAIRALVEGLSRPSPASGD